MSGLFRAGAFFQGPWWTRNYSWASTGFVGAGGARALQAEDRSRKTVFRSAGDPVEKRGASARIAPVVDYRKRTHPADGARAWGSLGPISGTLQSQRAPTLQVHRLERGPAPGVAALLVVGSPLS